MPEIDERALEAARKAWLESASDYTRLDESIAAACLAYESAKAASAGEVETGLGALETTFRHWDSWNRDQRQKEGLATEDNTHVISVPPHWPTHGNLRSWADLIGKARAMLSASPGYRG